MTIYAVGQTWYVSLPYGEGSDGMEELVEATIVELTNYTVRVKYIAPCDMDERKPKEILSRFKTTSVEWVELINTRQSLRTIK